MKHEKTYSAWLSELKAKFADANEFAVASAIYPFFNDFQEGVSPEKSFQYFDFWACGERDDSDIRHATEMEMGQ